MDSLTDIFHYGVVEQRDTDPLRLGRCKVRIIGIHTEDTEELPVEDLPWAYPMGNYGSASMSGIGISPVGPVEGTIVIVFFRDVYKQHPIIMGTLGGIPEEMSEYNTMLVHSEVTGGGGGNGGSSGGGSGGSGSGGGDSNGGSSSGGSGDQNNQSGGSSSTPPQEDKKPPIQKPGAMTVSDSGRRWMQDNEGLASTSQTGVKLGNSRTPDATKIYAYKDTGGVWTIGYGNTYYPDGSKVKEGDSMTKSQADTLFDQVHKSFENQVNRDLKVPVTQSMFDSLVDMSYNMGHGGLTSSKMWSALNSGRYEEAAALIPSTRATVKGKPSKGLDNRRGKQRSRFLKDGIPSNDNSKVNPDPTRPDEEDEIEDKTSNPSVRENKKPFGGGDTGGSGGDGSSDDNSGNSSSSSVKDIRKDKKTTGFRDPFEKYPKEEFLNEPDTSRLMRHERIDDTIVAKKEAARVENIKQAQDKTWSQPKIPYNALYPFNHVYSSESGHIQEFDDTNGNERIHIYHRSGTFEEIDKNGTLVRRIVGDKYEIFERNGFILVKGDVNLSVRGNVNIRVENDADIQILGNCKTEVSGNMETSVKGDYKVKAKSLQFEAYGGDIDVKATGRYSEDADGNIYMNSGITVPTGLKIPSEVAPGKPEFPDLHVPDRSNEFSGSYESEEEGDNTEFIQSMLAGGYISPPDVEPQEPDADNDPTEEPPEKEPPKKEEEKECGDDHEFPVGKGPYSSGTRLNKNWTLGQVCTGRSGIPNGTNYGKSAKEIVQNLQALADNVLDPIKKRYPNMIITNTWRSEAVNNSLKGASKTSDHLSGQAVDIQFSGFTRQQTYEAAIEIQKMLPDYNQILLEYMGKSMWIHVSYKSKCAGGGNKRQIMTLDVYNRKNNVNGKFVLYGAK